MRNVFLRFADMLGWIWARWFRWTGVIALVFMVPIACADASSREMRLPVPPPGFADEAFAAWLTSFRREALAQGIHAATFDLALRGIAPDPEVIEADQEQPEFVRPIWDYLSSAISDHRVARGQKELAGRQGLFKQLEAAYEVDAPVLAAIWGLESQYGDYMGVRNVVRSLATLGFEGRRADFGRSQLIAALKIIQRGDISRDEMVGSWAGAMGHTQFIPTTYNLHAVDFDGDGRRDIWHSPADALASAANYLKVSGWRLGQPWGWEIVLPDGFDYALADQAVRKPVAMWRALGLQKTDGADFQAGELEQNAALILPAGHRGVAFLVTDNFRVVLRYNNATAYSLAVNLLADRFRGRGGVRGVWPIGDQPLARAEREELQRLLIRRGFDTGGVDGVIGANTRAAVRAFQKHSGLPADGYPTRALLDRLRGV